MRQEGGDFAPIIWPTAQYCAVLARTYPEIVDLKPFPGVALPTMTAQLPELSAYGLRSVHPSPVNRMMSQFAAGFREGEDVNLGVGYVNEETLPRAEILTALSAVLADPERYRAALNYGASDGSRNLHDSIRCFLLRQCRPGLSRTLLDRCRIVVGANGVTSLLEAIATLLRPGLVVTSDPLYYIYSDFLERLGYQILPIPEDHDGLQVELIESRLAGLADRVAFFYVLGVGNPTSSILSNARRQQLIETVGRVSKAAGRPIPLFFDGAYEFLIHDPQVPPPTSVLGFEQDWVFELGTLSKLLAPALRIGYLLGRQSPFLDALAQRTNDVGFSAPLMNQEIASHLLDHMADAQLVRVNRGYRDKAIQVEKWLREALGSHLEDIVGGQAGFYFYLTLANIDTSEGSLFHRYCARNTGDPAIDGVAGSPGPRVIYIPGQYCVHATGDLATRGTCQLRLSYGYESLPQIEKGIRILAEAARYSEAGPTGARPR